MKEIIYSEEEYKWKYKWSNYSNSDYHEACSYKKSEAINRTYFEYIKLQKMGNTSKIHAMLNAFLYKEQLK